MPLNPCDAQLESNFEIAAPYPALQTTITLPRPYLSDQESVTASVTTKRATDGTLYTYVKRKNRRRKLKWDFTLSRTKTIEMENFVKAYFASQLRVRDHRGRVWIGYFTINPFDFTGKERAGGPATQDWPVGEKYTVSLEFEGIQQ